MTTYPTQPTGDNSIDLANIFASNSTNKIIMSTEEILEGYNNDGEAATPLTSTPDGNKFNYFWYQVHNTLAWVVNYIKALFDNKLEISGGIMSGSLAMGLNKITGLAAGMVSTDAINKGQLDALSVIVESLNPDIINLGNVSSNFTLTADTVHTANITSTCSLNFPTLSSSDKFINVMLTFTVVSGQTLNIPSNVKWNFGTVPTFTSTLGVKNRIIFDTEDGGLSWSGYYSQIGA